MKRGRTSEALTALVSAVERLVLAVASWRPVTENVLGRAIDAAEAGAREFRAGTMTGVEELEEMA